MGERGEYRTSTQIDANHTDCEIYRLVNRLDGMAARLHEPDFKKAADAVASARHLVRKHMHKHDLETTNG